MPTGKEIWKVYKDNVLKQLSWKDVYGDIDGMEESGDEWVLGWCPLHNDKDGKQKSFAFNLNTLAWVCFSGCGKGSVFDFIMIQSGWDFRETLCYLGDKKGVPRPNIPGSKTDQGKNRKISESLVRTAHKTLMENNAVIKYLKQERGLSKETIKKYAIGIKKCGDCNRITIPIRDKNKHVRNIRLYNPKEKKKIINYTSKGKRYGTPPRLYGIDELVKYDGNQIIYCEGEWDRLVLMQNGFMAVTGTHGVGTFPLDWIEHFEGKDVVVICDCDESGQKAASEKILPALKKSQAHSVKNVVLPLSGKDGNNDITDYFVKHKKKTKDLQTLINHTHIYSFGDEESGEKTDCAEEENDIIELDSFTEIENNKLIDKHIQCEITVCGETSEAFHAVSEFCVDYCQKLQKGQCKEPMMCMQSSIEIPVNSQEYIGSCMSTNAQVIGMLRNFVCKFNQKATFEILKRRVVKEFFAHQKVNRITQVKDKNGNVVQYIDGEQQELLEKKVYYLSSENIKPGNYLATGYVKTHPKTQQVTFLIESLIPQQDDFQSFNIREKVDSLKKYKTVKWDDIMEDLSENVTHVYDRDEILATILLTYTSPLHITFGKNIIRGWIISAIIGDSGTGKTQTYTNLSEYINLGDCFSGLTGSRTGLSYALVDHKQRGWQVKIGRYPANSRKILAIDEGQHIDEFDLRGIGKAMDEGFLQIDRVKSRGYECKTRLIFICNPKNDRVMDSFSFGCETVKSIFSPPIARRIDLFAFANSGDFKDISFINRQRESHTKHIITPDMLKSVIYWTWNLGVDQIEFAGSAVQACLNKANVLGERFGYAVDVPIILREDVRNTIARVSASIASLLFSTNDDYSKLVVTDEHVEMASNLIDIIYSHDNCALDDYSEIKKRESQLEDYDDIEKSFLGKIENEKHDYTDGNNFIATIKLLRINDKIRRQELVDQVGCSEYPIKEIISLLRRFNLIHSTKYGYMKKPKFNKFLRKFIKKNAELF